MLEPLPSAEGGHLLGRYPFLSLVWGLTPSRAFCSRYIQSSSLSRSVNTKTAYALLADGFASHRTPHPIRETC